MQEFIFKEELVDFLQNILIELEAQEDEDLGYMSHKHIAEVIVDNLLDAGWLPPSKDDKKDCEVKTQNEMDKNIMQEFIFKNESEAQAACEWWQKQLRLTDWQIRVKFCHVYEFDKKTCDAEILHNHFYNRAVIHMRYPDEIEPSSDYITPPDQEDDLVHELLHLLFAKWENNNENDDVDKERALNYLSEAFVNLRRLAYPKPPWRGKS